ncbi:MAG: B12-binding domain-containing radical SAM protein [Acidobacteria bacterium]|nr:B12-binding domain-containing radical SAM protein [Acidobacteriota bacterium]
MRVLVISPDRNHGLRLPEKPIFPLLGPLVVAGLFDRARHEVRFFDETVEAIDFDRPADLACLTAMTATAPRAYEIAREFRRRGVRTIMGGIHASFCPEEAASHCDTVVVGEAEQVFPQILADLEAGRPRRIYGSLQTRPDLQAMASPRYDLVRRRAYFLGSVSETRRGCPYDCEFCTVKNMFGRRVRDRDIDEAIDAIERMVAVTGRHVFFADDDFTAQWRQATAFCRRLIERCLRIDWICQSDIKVTDHPELLELMARSGCGGMFIGYESLQPEAGLKKLGRATDLRRSLLERTRILKRHGLAIQGGFVFGWDHDTPDVFDRTLDFIFDAGLDFIQASALTPFPGTELRDRLLAEGRVTHPATSDVTEWARYNFVQVVIRPARMGQEELQEGVLRVWRTFYSGRNVAARLLRNTPRCFRGKPARDALTQAAMKTMFDINYHRMVRNIDRSYKSFC